MDAAPLIPFSLEITHIVCSGGISAIIISAISCGIPSLANISLIMSFMLRTTGGKSLLVFSAAHLKSCSSLIPSLFANSFVIFELCTASLSALIITLYTIERSWNSLCGTCSKNVLFCSVLMSWNTIFSLASLIMLSTSTSGACSYALSMKSHAAISVSSRSPQS